MGWFWDSKPAANDAYSKLDPALREYLDKESPVKYQTTQAPSKPETSGQPSQSYRSQLGWDQPGPTATTQAQVPDNATSNPTTASVPPESLFPDGRYAHLWSTYRSQTSIESSGKSDQDRMKDVLDAYSDRRSEIGRAALQNCVMEQMAEKDCFTNGSWMKRMTMCKEENRSFIRCYEMQSRFLKALGYLSVGGRSEMDEERVQMHADRLYHEMLEREEMAETARKEGRETPVLPPLISGEATVKALGEESAFAKGRREAQEKSVPTTLSSFSPEKQAVIKRRLEGLSDMEKEVELQLVAAESRTQKEYAQEIRVAMEDESKARKLRREQGKETVGDRVKRMWGWE
ncbi:hypothetical protein B0A48_18040 [Cryoendolithus antarcticus]|uniref:Autophagy protein n=1 Tax=Cryoendolithus antarcticus TaxID=1507870 RepID=A0A1V8SAE1_9PEZI|nr:hypothetical protein B0A48_18040 [Cryoendolithus antarcticus]